MYVARPRWLGHRPPPRVDAVGRPPAHPYPVSTEAKPHLLSSPREAAINTPPPPLLSSPFTTATASPDADTLECPSNVVEQEHCPHAALLPRADRCEESPKPPHVVHHFHRGRLIDGHQLWPSPALGFTTMRAPLRLVPQSPASQNR
jgi:hypothetical protein